MRSKSIEICFYELDWEGKSTDAEWLRTQGTFSCLLPQMEQIIETRPLKPRINIPWRHLAALPLQCRHRVPENTFSGSLSSLVQHHSLKASILQCSAFLMVQLSHPYMTTGKTMPLTIGTFVGKVMSLLFNRLSRLVIIAFLPRNKCLLISWLQAPSTVILEPQK